MSDFNIELNGSDARRYIDYLVEQRIEEKRLERHERGLPVIMCKHCKHYSNDASNRVIGTCEKHSKPGRREGNVLIVGEEVEVAANDHVCVFFAPSAKFKPSYDRLRKEDNADTRHA